MIASERAAIALLALMDVAIQRSAPAASVSEIFERCSPRLVRAELEEGLHRLVADGLADRSLGAVIHYGITISGAATARAIIIFRDRVVNYERKNSIQIPRFIFNYIASLPDDYVREGRRLGLVAEQWLPTLKKYNIDKGKLFKILEGIELTRSDYNRGMSLDARVDGVPIEYLLAGLALEV